MESEQFDAFVRRALGESSRRGLVRGGLGILTGAALSILGLSAADDADAKRRRRKKNKKKSPPPPPPPPPPARFPNQTPCTSSAQCASGTCAFNGLGQVCCVQNGGRCGADFDCCGTLLCDFGTGTCF